MCVMNHRVWQHRRTVGKPGNSNVSAPMFEQYPRRVAMRKNWFGSLVLALQYLMNYFLYSLFSHLLRKDTDIYFTISL
jgi:hypothetical protein